MFDPLSNAELNPTQAIRNVFIAGIGIMLLKFVAFFITHSTAILSDALESIINVVAGGFAYYSIVLASKPKDREHPYGHGKIEFISAGFEGGLILLAGLVIVGRSILNMMHPMVIEQMNIGALLIGIGGIANFLLGQYLIKKGTEHKSITLVADGKHLLSDTWSSVGLVAGIILIYITGWLWLDNILAIVFACIIIVTGYKLFRKSVAGLMDEADEQILQDVIQVLNEHRIPNWIDIHNLRIVQYGSSYHIDCHITLPWYNNLQVSHEELVNIEKLIIEKYHSKVELFIHADPCLPISCSVCSVQNCTERKHPFKQKIEWTIDNVMKNEKHQL